MTALRPEHTHNVFSKGFTVVPAAVDQAFATELRASLASMVADQRAAANERTQIDDYMVHNPMMSDSRFFDLLENATIVDALDTFLGPTSILYAYTSSSMPAGGSNYSRRVHVDSPRVIPGYMTNLGVIVALDDFRDDNGATFFLPGSFERLDPPTEEEFFADAERVHPRRGDLVVFNARTWHYGGLNTTDEDRHAVTLNACRAYMRQRFDYPRLVGSERATSMSPTLRRILGFDVRVPTSLEEYYLPEDQRLYKANQG
ncbi:MAG: phytanoyl-CoA dioxygenase family protein [Ilumatobacteraceae bacterium]